MTSDHAAKTLFERHPGRRLSQVLRDLEAGDGERVSVGDIVGALRDRSFAPALVVFAAPNLLLFVPGSSFFTGLPLMFLAAQLVLGRPNLWLPRFVATLSVERAAFRRIVSTTVPYVERIERLARPRWWPVSYPIAERLIGLATLILAVCIFLPIPLANGLPSVAIIMLSLSLSERDGYWLAGGLLFTLASIVVVIGMISLGTFAVLGFF